MNVVIQILGRDAIPVRALPWLTDWWFCAEKVSEALAQDKENYPDFLNVHAYRFKGDVVELVPGREWRNVVSYHIQNIIDKHLPNDQWRCEASAAMPAGAFVWRDQWEQAYNSPIDGVNYLALDEDLDAAQKREDQALNLCAMVPPEFEHLVEEGFAKSESAPAPQVGPKAAGEAEPAAVAPNTSNNPPPLGTADIASCFGGLHWTTEKWKKPLGDKPKWLQSCVVIPGVRGGSETQWDPVCIGAALVRNRHAKVNSVRAKFQTAPSLNLWLDAWKTYEADNFGNN